MNYHETVARAIAEALGREIHLVSETAIIPLFPDDPFDLSIIVVEPDLSAAIAVAQIDRRQTAVSSLRHVSGPKQIAAQAFDQSVFRHLFDLAEPGSSEALLKEAQDLGRTRGNTL